jgi:hypothetical protein
MWSFVIYTWSILFFLYLIAVLVIKYIAIYHSTLVNRSFDEAIVIDVMRISLLGLSILLETIESRYLNNAENLAYAHVLLHGDLQNYETSYIITTLVSLTVLITIGLQASINFISDCPVTVQRLFSDCPAIVQQLSNNCPATVHRLSSKC